MIGPQPAEATLMPKALLQPREQSTVATLAAVALGATVVVWVARGGLSGRLIEVDRADQVPYEFLVDLNHAECSALTSLQLFDPLEFSCENLKEPAFDHRTSPAVDAAEKIALDLLASGPVPAADAISAIVDAGFSRGTAFRVKARHGIVSVDGCWVLPVAFAG